MFNYLLRTIFLPVRMALALLKPFTTAVDVVLRPFINRILNRTLASNQAGFFDDYFANHVDPLLRGDLLAASERDWPRDRHPTFYRRIPLDLRRSIIVDGRIRGSAVLPIEVFPAASIDQALVDDSKRMAIWAAAKWFLLSLVIGIAFSGMVIFAPMMNAFHLPAWHQPAGVDFWSADDLIWNQKVDVAMSAVVYFSKLVLASSLASIIVLWTSVVLAVAVGLNVFWGTWRSLIFKSADRNADKIRTKTKEATVRWKNRYDIRDVQEDAYLEQLNEVDRLKSPTIEIGESTGLFSFRGSLSGPRQKTKIQLSVEDLFQGTLTLGGTGSGKTYGLIIPVAAQIIKLQDVQDISIYATDSKAVLWKDLAELATKMGKKYQVIGVNQGELGVDLLDGLEPGFAADLIKSVMRQMGGTSGDSFWPDLAHNMCVHTLKVLEAWERTKQGLQYALHTGERPYSLVRLYEVSMQAKNNGGQSIVAKMEREILDTIENDYEKISDLVNVGLFSSLEYLRETWPTMANDTRSGIEANITNALGNFVSNIALRKKFASGENSDITVDEFWGRKITLVNLPSSLGNAGRIINVMLKSLIFNKAKERQAANPNIREEQQLAFIADEFQSLITTDLNSGFTDSSFPNEARSTGMFYFVATQGVKALEQAVGQDSATNFIINMRNKIFLQIEEPQTMDLSKKLAGKTLRFYSYDNNDHESSEAMRREVGYDQSLLGPALITHGIKESTSVFNAVSNLWREFQFEGMREKFVSNYVANLFNAHKSDQRFNNAQRAEDKNIEYMKSGNEFHDVLSDSDLMSMGRTHAYMCITRGGNLRQDIIKLRGVRDLMPELFEKAA